MKKLITIFLVVLLTFTTSVQAEDLAITGNGQSSQNEIQTVTNNQTTVTQNNDSQIINNVEATSNTGQNQANQNTNGQTTIQTGSASLSTEVINATNTSGANLNCCPNTPSNNSSIEGNGASSNNHLNQSQTSNTSVTLNQNAKITTNITGSANTGNNKALKNGDHTTILTGDIRASNQIINTNINSSQILVPVNFSSSSNAKISGNGATTNNNIYTNYSSTNTIKILNDATINNLINFYANSGGNIASYNNGDVFIKTGNIILDNLIKNVGINTSKVEIASCLCNLVPNPPTKENPPISGGGSTTPGSNPGGGGGGGIGGGPGSVLGSTLPSTGDNTLIYLTLALLIVLALGLVLKYDQLFKFFSAKSSYMDSFLTQATYHTFSFFSGSLIVALTLIKKPQFDYKYNRPTYGIYPS